MKVNWTPKRKGDIYCSPACGGKCTWGEYQAVMLRGKEMRRSMDRPEEWSVRGGVSCQG